MIESRLYTKTKDIYNTVNHCILTYTQVDCSCGTKYENSEKIMESEKKIKGSPEKIFKLYYIFSR